MLRKTDFPAGADPVEDGATVREAVAPFRTAPNAVRSDRRKIPAPQRPLAAPARERRSSWSAGDASQPMLWTGANEGGKAVFGVAASATDQGIVEIAAVVGSPDGSCRTLRRSLSPHEARQLALHLVMAADDAERREAMQLVAIG